MDNAEKIFVAGAQGMVGSALVRRLQAKGYTNLLAPARDELDLTSQQAVADYFAEHRPDYVFLAAAKVGGIYANNTYPAEFIQINLAIQGNVIHQAWVNGVKRLLFLGSSCIYPRLAPQPMREEHLLSGPLEPSNEPYAIAKISGIKMCEAYNRQYGTRFVAVMPTNLYGPGDNFHPENSHVLPALLRRFHEAREAGQEKVVVWADGTPMREFLYVDDMADGCLHVMNLDDQTLSQHLLNYPKPCFVNLGVGEDISIRDLSEMVSRVVGFPGEIEFDTSKPGGTPRKLLDVSRMQSLGWRAETDLASGLEKTYHWYLQHRQSVRG